MIVKNNSNTSAKNGSCSIVRAGANETGENYIYDFTYYVNKDLIDGDSLNKVLYDTTGASGADWGDDFDPDTMDTNCNGYYTRLKLINAALDREQEKNDMYFIPMN
jgi:hypothetical protein